MIFGPVDAGNGLASNQTHPERFVTGSNRMFVLAYKTVHYCVGSRNTANL
jgi:hypothetical protein